jgi:hypothetical protein
MVPKVVNHSPVIHELESVPKSGPSQMPDTTHKRLAIHEMESAPMVGISYMSSSMDKRSAIHGVEGGPMAGDSHRLKTVDKHPTVHGMESAPMIGANHTPNNMEQRPAMHEMEGTPSKSTTNNAAHRYQGTIADSKPKVTMFPYNEARNAHTRRPSTCTLTSDGTTACVPNKPNTALLDAVLSAVTKPSDVLLKDICRNPTRAVFSISTTVEDDVGLLEDGLQKYKTTEGGVTLWWKPYRLPGALHITAELA